MDFLFAKTAALPSWALILPASPGLPGPPVRMAINRTEQRKYQVNKTKIRADNRRRNSLSRRRFTRNLPWLLLKTSSRLAMVPEQMLWQELWRARRCSKFCAMNSDGNHEIRISALEDFNPGRLSCIYFA